MYKQGEIESPNAADPSGIPQESAHSVKVGATKAVATKLTVRPGMETRFAAWQAEFTRVVSAAHGFVSLEIIPAFSGSAEWQIIQRFRSPEALTRWLEDGARTTLLADLAALEGDGKGSHADEAAPDYHSTTTVTEVITTVVRAGQEEAFRRWAQRIQQVQACFSGYMGTLVQAPLSPEVPYWTTLVRFESPAFLDAWLQSAERKAILAEAAPQVSTWRSHRMSNPFAGWFANEQRLAPPPAWKQTCLVLLVLFPVVMLEIRFLSPLLSGLPLAVSTFIGNAISVSLVSWPLMAVAIFGLGWWLKPDAQKRWRTEALGVTALAALYALELIVFSHLM
ncbi:antibiotic biosynthesis monooxygenase [Methylobacterium sp. Leaf123]|uniref:antibiotic biosynthesis monooxygenase n=1 Tax=Methylobacterium sp. Leaf123 TaxID=1736264 RepID=UPI0006FBD7B5|nr:antibiotic biosynthesis monooxygenase [Methylobacterium sp. Leaf123]KQQ25102.1 antibiotic biosynthesis monooxygenase [Methylobacterium sp. Leaf123]